MFPFVIRKGSVQHPNESADRPLVDCGGSTPLCLWGGLPPPLVADMTLPIDLIARRSTSCGSKLPDRQRWQATALQRRAISIDVCLLNSNSTVKSNLSESQLMLLTHLTQASS